MHAQATKQYVDILLCKSTWNAVFTIYSRLSHLFISVEIPVRVAELKNQDRGHEVSRSFELLAQVVHYSLHVEGAISLYGQEVIGKGHLAL